MMREIKNCVVAGKCVRMRVPDYVMVLFASVMLTVCVSVHDPGKKGGASDSCNSDGLFFLSLSHLSRRLSSRLVVG
jgi:hypothetical protein